jgi:WD40 repeat protein
MLASTGEHDSHIRFWDVATGRALRAFVETGRQSPHAVAFSPDGTRLAVICSNGAVQCWNVALGHKQWEKPGHQAAGEGQTVVFAPDGRRFATAGRDRKVRLWETDTGAALLVLPFAREQDDPRAFRPIAFSGDEKVLAFGDGRDIIFYDPTPGREVARIKDAHGENVLGLAFGPDGKTLISSGSRAVVHQGIGTLVAQLRMWDVARGTLLRDFFGESAESTTGCVFALSRDGRTVVSEQGNKLIVWDVATGQRKRTIPDYWLPLSGGDRRIQVDWPVNARGIACSPDGKTLAVAGMSHCNVLLWDLATGKQKPAFPDAHASCITAIVGSPDSSRIATSGDRTVRIWSAADGKQLNAFVVSDFFLCFCSSLAFAGDGKMLAGACFEEKSKVAYGFVRVWNSETGAVRREIEALGNVTKVAIARDGATLALEADDPYPTTFPYHPPARFVIIVDARTGVKRRRIKLKDRLAGLALSPDAATVSAVDGAGSLDVWDAGTGQLVRHWVVPKSAPKSAIAERLRRFGLAYSAAISPDCTRAVVSCFGDDAATIWDLMQGVEIGRLNLANEGNLASVVALSPNKRMIATAAWFGAQVRPESSGIRLWDAGSGRLLKSYSIPAGNCATWLEFTADGRRLISAMADGTALLWNVPSF